MYRNQCDWITSAIPLIDPANSVSVKLIYIVGKWSVSNILVTYIIGSCKLPIFSFVLYEFLPCCLIVFFCKIAESTNVKQIIYIEHQNKAGMLNIQACWQALKNAQSWHITKVGFLHTPITPLPKTCQNLLSELTEICNVLYQHSSTFF